MSTADRGLDWLLENLLTKTPGARHALVLSRDGLKMVFTSQLDDDRADQLSAVAAGIQSLSLSASADFGDGSITSGQAMVEFAGGVLLIVPAGAGAHLAVVAEEDTDVGVVGHNMNELVEQIGSYLTADPRPPQYSGGPAS
ncbi:roadblock/LC7 domain-containing protein [Streptomonospora salina]|uniref:Putative regulator of Ras-like GTPase activity (Roadblock/LC7/MglB family) n=1 Tax=Streptomonospora salina TaxID=104205 RepID=A0A841E4K5_9ACTN|nr:roadblock/LC7 domain-containing protein [Streptomonospora salina]MBB5997374.1 putative regulator of Ras-like GTPase activity (Roadblock/LC7/MglB family) [Streptomonospora salina]